MTTKSFLKARFTAALAHKHGAATKTVVTNSLEEVESRLKENKQVNKPSNRAESNSAGEVKGTLVRETALTEEDLKGLIIKREKPGKPAAAKKFIDKKPSARVIGVNLLEELYKNEQVGKVLATKDSTTTATGKPVYCDTLV
ncbi:hypothetical protein GNI_034950 [Gregarina niphandrodes]|uniref:Uncharacterized protein n=1 Tax=Gregarina niphandrodes TaxID=110365 RepID=A0A023BB12_GRENI|nr:hypothetical protein GNI_034950 [Gregarina niphandrodes]EZG78553.1 hypothetical protein GNI_034950 [Gregarina niphandrodes]|eukprot:XP_011129259.1 hypothetical protein GNI_034950 [Gregarina niphandrodes]